ncbi:40S ribosomal protein S9 [Xylariaceae sp. FL0255]|nr:40S ribosomal protein S9 [Xylariaceae sp. FL0255]
MSSSLRCGLRYLRGLRASTKKQWPATNSNATILPKSSVPRRAFATTIPRMDDSLEQRLQASDDAPVVGYARPMPASPSYFSRFPVFMDSFVQVQEYTIKYARLPVLPPEKVERVSWKSKDHYRRAYGEKVRAREFATALAMAKRLHQIHPDLLPEEVALAIKPFKRSSNAFLNVPKFLPIDRFGRSHGVGKRKSSIARAWIVEGTGEVLINGKTMNDAFARVHDRESALWAMKSADRIDKYNVWALVEGGGTTGQAEALAMATAKALCVHEPALKPILKRAGCITRDPRRVERKKPGHTKARKSPAWVKR